MEEEDPSRESMTYCWWFRNPPPPGCIKPCKNNGINYQPQLFRRISSNNSINGLGRFIHLSCMHTCIKIISIVCVYIYIYVYIYIGSYKLKGHSFHHSVGETNDAHFILVPRSIKSLNINLRYLTHLPVS